MGSQMDKRQVILLACVLILAMLGGKLFGALGGILGGALGGAIGYGFVKLLKGRG